MALNARLVSELMRQRFGLPDNSQAARFINLIPEALKETGRKVAADEMLRPLLVTNKATTTGAISAGKVDLAALYTSNQIMLEYFDLGQIYLNSGTYPMQKLATPNQAALPNYLTAVYNYYYIQGDSLYVVPSSTTGTISFAVPYYPVNLAALPESEEIERLFLDVLANLSAMPNQGA